MQEYLMRKTILAVSAAAAVTLSSPAFAQPADYAAYPPRYYAPAVGAVAGTLVGLGFSEHWWHGPHALTSAAGAAAVGFVAGVGTLVLIDAFTTPCRGFRIAVDSPAACASMNEAPLARVARRAR
jgi:hypothetical protein